MSSPTATVLVERHGDIAVVTLNRPDRRNGVTVEMCLQLHARFVEISQSDAKVLVLRGAGSEFSVGADLTGPDAEERPTMEQVGHAYHAATLLYTMPQVTIAAIDGGCAGAALGWACACDFRFASERAKFATAFLHVGVSGDMGLIWSLSRLVGPARAREMLLFPEKFASREALAWGLVTRVFPADQLHAETLALAEALARRPAFPLRMMKANLVSAEAMDLQSYIELESARHLHVANTPSLAAGIAAFRAGAGPKS